MCHSPIRTALLAAALAVATTGIAQAQDTLTAPKVRAQLEAQGYTKIKDVKFDDGLWEAEATSANGKRVDVRLDPATGTIYPETSVSQLSEADIRARLSTAGYTRVKDLKFDDGLWKAEATDANGQKLELRLDPTNGKVIGRTQD